MSQRQDLGHAAATPTRPRRRRWRVWTLRSLFLLIVLVCLIGATVDAVLTTRLPRNVVVTELERKFGLRISATSLSTGWLGNTTLRDVRLALPLADDSFVDLPLLDISHNNLISILLRRPVRIDAVHLDHPHLIVRQDPLGRWNVHEAVSLISRAVGSSMNDPATGRLPTVSVNDGTVELIGRAGQSTTLAPLDAQGRPNGLLSWDFTARLPSHVELTGRIVPGHKWRHEVAFAIQDANQLLRPWAVSWPKLSNLIGQWRGEWTGDTLAGRLDLQDAQVANTRLSGAIQAQSDGNTLTLTPQTFLADFRDVRPIPIRLTAGSIKVGGTSIEAHALQLGLMGGIARLSGRYDWGAVAGNLDAAWRDLVLPGDIRHGGELKLSLATPWAGRQQMEAMLTTRGMTPQGNWDAQALLTGEGSGWSKTQYHVNVPRLSWKGTGGRIDVRELSFRLDSEYPVLRLAGLTIPQPDRLSGSGEVDLATLQWRASLLLRQWSPPRIAIPSDISIDAYGDAYRIDIAPFQIQTPTFHASAQGFYDSRLPQPVDLNVTLWRSPLAAADAAQQQITSRGLRGQARATGTAQPLNIHLAGQLVGQDVVWGRRQLGDIQAQVDGRITPDTIALQSRELQLLNGHWRFNARYAFADDSARVGVNVRGLSLAHADELLKSPIGLAGTLSASMYADWPRRRPEERTIAGDWVVNNFRKAGFAANQIRGRIAMNGNELTLEDVLLREKNGVARATVRYDLRDRDRLLIDADAQQWPVEFQASPLSLKVSGKTRLDTTISSRSAVGPLSVSIDAMLKQQPLGTIRLQSNFGGRHVQLASLEADAFGGRFEGQGRVAFDDWTRSTGHLRWQGIDASAIARVWPVTQDLAGVFDGSVAILQNPDPHATEPVLVDLSISSVRAQYRSTRIGPIDATLAAGRKRVILSRARIDVADGVATLWGRLTEHDGEAFAMAQLTLSRVDFNQIAGLIRLDDDKATLGRLSGQVTAYGPLLHRYQINGEADLRLIHSNLVDGSLFRAIYRTLNPSAPPPPPTGRGRINLRLERGMVIVPNFFYRNTGIWLHFSGTIQDLFMGRNSPLSGYAIATTRPLRDIDLPVVAQLSDILADLQSTVLTYRVEGTLGDRKLRSAGLSEALTDVRRLLLGTRSEARAIRNP